MKLSPFSKPTIEPAERWLKNAKAAELLGVTTRTIKRWMTNAAMRNALGAVRQGKQWRIPLPKSFNGESEFTWEMHTHNRLKEIGVHLQDSWEKGFEELGKQFARYELETYRLWLAAHSQLSVKSDGVTQEDITAILLLWQTACKILDPLPKGTEVDKLKSKFPGQLQARNVSEDRIRLIMSYWPEQNCFKPVRAARTLEQLEKIRTGMDTAQAVKTCKNHRQKPTADNLRPLLHENFMEHINDTRDALPGIVVKNPTGEEMNLYAMAGVQDQIMGKTPPLVTFDLRKPQTGLALRTFRKRHPLKNSPLKKVIQAVYHVQDGIPSVDDKPDTGKTPVRGG
jgi:hypothetical protein